MQPKEEFPHLLVLLPLGVQRLAPLVEQVLLLPQSLRPPLQLLLLVLKLRLKALELRLRVYGLGVVQGLEEGEGLKAPDQV